MLVGVFGPGHFPATEVCPGYEYRAGRGRALKKGGQVIDPRRAEDVLDLVLPPLSMTEERERGPSRLNV